MCSSDLNNVLLSRSACPSDLGWKGVVLDFSMPARRQSSCINLDSKFFPWSECNCRGIPKREKKLLYMADMQVCASASGRAYASDYFTKWSEAYALPDAEAHTFMPKRAKKLLYIADMQVCASASGRAYASDHLVK